MPCDSPRACGGWSTTRAPPARPPESASRTGTGRRGKARPTPRRGRPSRPDRPPGPTRSASRLGDLGLAGAAVGADLDGQDFFLDPVLVLEEIGCSLRERDDDSVGQLEPGLLAHRVQPVDQVEDAALELELFVEGRVECDGDAVAARDRPALLPGPLDEHLLGGEVAARGPEASVRELIELARFESGANRAELLAELRPEHRQVRLDAQLGGAHFAEFDLFHAELLADLVGVLLGARSPLDDEPTQRLPKLEPRRRAHLAAELDYAARLGHVGDEHLPQMLGEERHHRPDRAQSLDERVPERPEGGLVERIEAPARPPDVPVREVIDE